METILYPVLGYFLGALPFGLWITRLVKGVDIRDGGSGHVTTTNTIRQAGWLPGIIVLLLDIGKGFLPTYLAFQAGLPDWAVALTGAMTVTGHCWPIFAQFRGGMGLATTGGSYLAISVLAFPIGMGVLIALTLIIRHSARAAFFAAFAIPLALLLFGQVGTVLMVSIATSIIIAIRFTIDWNREYRELWLDRDQKAE